MKADFDINGRLTKPPELKQTPGGVSVASFTIAVNQRYKEKEEVSFFRVTAFGKNAENCVKYLGKGSLVCATSKMKQREWKTDSGESRSSVDFHCDRVIFLSTKSENTKGSGHQGFTPEDDDIAI